MNQGHGFIKEDSSLEALQPKMYVHVDTLALNTRCISKQF